MNDTTATAPTAPTGAPAAPETARAIAEDDARHLFRGWVQQGTHRALPVAGAAGSWFWDHAGNRYLDFSSQLVYTNLGHQHPRLVSAIQEQAGKLCTIAPHFAEEQRATAARKIAEVAPAGLERVLFTSSGAEAVEHAVRLARLHTGRFKLLAAHHSFHGATSTAIQLTGDPRRWRNDTGNAGVVRFFAPYLYRSSFYAENEEQECLRALEHLEQVIVLEGARTIAAIVLEPVGGTSSGVLVPPDGYLAGVRELCTRYGIMLILDEIMVGFARTGAWFATDHWGVRPDLMTFAKGVNSGYLPLSGVLVGDEIVETFSATPYPGGSTYSGHPMACAVAVAAIDTMRDEGTVEHSARLGREVFGPELARIAERHPSVGEARGIGTIWALELVRNKKTKEMYVNYDTPDRLTPPGAQLMGALMQRGVSAMVYLNRLNITPPCNISEEDAREGLARIDEALTVADAHTH
ncbi:aminotransferase class III-fold pyridoxal phosphate-dependent enzyme [Kitasatospora sp. NPDC056327]|uniref:aminotransferase class III-fold pyridoxal phosphate-dependent enzyme n=1 Tax=Kitasatospora sp. NPDC056327 TaxID=3345785 RepID=UPI0035DD1C60